MGCVIRYRVDNGTTQHVESVFFGVVDLQDPKGFSDIVANEFLVGLHVGYDVGRPALGLWSLMHRLSLAASRPALASDIPAGAPR
jgi:hypothetical protein